MFVVVEGVDGCGKSTALAGLVTRLAAAGATVTATREPGGSTTLGPALRQLLLHDGEGMCARAEALLFMADRAQHVAEVIGPALERGDVVVCDRFTDSTLAYQGAGRGLPLADLRAVSSFASAGLEPDLVVVLDVAPEVAAQRRAVRDGPAADRMEAAGLGDSVRGLLLSRAAGDPGRYRVLDASGSPEEVADALAALVAARMRDLAGRGR